MEIRPFEINDLDQVAILFDQYRIFYHQPSDVGAAKEFLKERIELKDSAIFVAEDNGKILGFTQLYPSYSSIALMKLWILNDLFVTEELRRSGIATALMDAAEDFARRSGARGMTLKTAVTNYKAQRLYERRKWLRDEGFFVYNLKFK